MRTLTIGLDGCSWNVLEPLLETGAVPHLSALRERGATGVLESTIPFYTGPAWASFATGTSPGAHGIYDFMLLREGDRMSVAHASDLRRTTYYEELDREGKRSVLINLPLDQEGVEGAIIVNSWLTDDDDRRLFPVDRRARYARQLSAYRNYPVTFGAELGRHVDDLSELEQARFALARELYLGEDWDHFFILFSSTDWLGHAATGRFLAGEREAREAFLRLYRELDAYVGWLVEHAPDATVAVVSDHGQCEETHSVHVNTVLRELGLVRLLRERPSDVNAAVAGDASVRATIRVPTFLGQLRSVPLLARGVRATKKLLQRHLGVDLLTPRRGFDVDRVLSRAFSPTVASYSVYTRECDEDEIARIARALAGLQLDDGRPAFEGIWTPEELYGRSLSGLAPSLIFAPSPGVRPSIAVREPVVERAGERGRGAHQRDGIIVLAGPEIAARDLGRVSLYDVAPTLLWAMGAGIPAGVDGRVLFEAFRDDFAIRQEVREVEAEAGERYGTPREEASTEVERRLRALGYL
jgi:predicted AlkP superfamily phosphohydrolase/phosphomutase